MSFSNAFDSFHQKAKKRQKHLLEFAQQTVVVNNEGERKEKGKLSIFWLIKVGKEINENNKSND